MTIMLVFIMEIEEWFAHKFKLKLSNLKWDILCYEIHPIQSAMLCMFNTVVLKI